jgi:TonB family protein
MKTPKLQVAGRALLAAAILFIIPVHSWSQESAGARKLITKTAAVYPPLARSMNLHGVVKLEAHVAPNGTVKSVVVKGGHPILTQSAVTAVGHWKFEPAPRETTEPVEIAFNLD